MLCCIWGISSQRFALLTPAPTARRPGVSPAAIGHHVVSPTGRSSHGPAGSARGGVQGEGRTGLPRDDPGAGPGPGRGSGRRQGLRGLPHRPALPRGRHQRRLPVPARPRGGRRGRVRRARRDRPGPGRLRRPQLARGVRRVPLVPARAALVLLLHAQRHPEDDPGRRDAALPRPGHRRLRGPDAGGGRAVHQGQPAGAARGRGPARLRGDGRPRRRHVHRRRRPGRLGGRLRLRRRRVCRRGRVEAGRGGRHHRRRPGPGQARNWPSSSAPPTPSTPARPTRSRPSSPTPEATAPTCASRRWATPR